MYATFLCVCVWGGSCVSQDALELTMWPSDFGFMILLPPSLQYWEYRSRSPHPVYIVLGIKCRALCTNLPTVIPLTYLQTCINLAAENLGPLQNLKETHSFEVVGAAYVRLDRLRASESQWQVREAPKCHSEFHCVLLIGHSNLGFVCCSFSLWKRILSHPCLWIAACQ